MTTAALASSLALSMLDLAAATRRRGPSCHVETSNRRALRCLLDGAGLAGAQVSIGFYKLGGELRYMLAEPVPGADQTAQYVTVKDIELSQEAGRPVYRRVNLDTVAGLRLDYYAGQRVRQG